MAGPGPGSHKWIPRAQPAARARGNDRTRIRGFSINHGRRWEQCREIRVHILRPRHTSGSWRRYLDTANSRWPDRNQRYKEKHTMSTLSSETEAVVRNHLQA